MHKFIFLLLILFFPTNVFALSSIVMDIDTGRIIYQKNSNNKQLIASTTKIMTAIVAIENGKLEKKVTVGEEVLKMYGTNIYVEVGEKMSLKDLLYGLLLRSGNDASLVIAKAVSGDEDKFVELMNKKAKELGMKNTSFANPHGLDEETKNYSTAYDMAILSRYAYKNKVYKKISSTKKYEVSTGDKTYLWYNRNKLLNNYKYCTSGKNGYTPSAGKTLVTTASKDGLNLTVVTLGDGNSYNTHKNLYEKYFHKLKKYEIISKNNFKLDKTFVNDNVYIKGSFYYPLYEDEIDQIKTIVSINTSVNGKEVGKITIYLKNKKIGDVPIYRKEKEKDKALSQKIKSLF